MNTDTPTQTHTGPVIPSQLYHRRAIATSHGVFLIPNDNHPAVQVGEEVAVRYAPEDQFAYIQHQPEHEH